MKTKKMIAVLLAATMLAAMCLAGCSSNNSTSGNSNSPATSAPDNEKIYNLTFSDFNPEGTNIGTCVKEALAKIEEDSNGRIKFTTHFGGTLLESSDVLTGVGEGLADIAVYTVGSTSGALPVSELLMQRFFREVPDYEGLNEVFGRSLREIPEFQEDAAKLNLKFLAIEASPSAVLCWRDDFANSVNTPSDMAGKVIQASGSYINALQTVGVSGLSMPISDWYTNFERGIVDALAMNWAAMSAFGLAELAESYVTFGDNGGLSVTGISMVMNLNTWNELPEDLQQIIQEGFDYYVQRSYEVNSADCEKVEAAEAEAKIVHHISQEDMQPWYDLALVAVEDWKSKVNDAGYDANGIFDAYCAIIDEVIAEK